MTVTDVTKGVLEGECCQFTAALVHSSFKSLLAVIEVHDGMAKVRNT